MERLADRLGRQIRYGGPPAPRAGKNPEAARVIVGAMMSLSETWAGDEPAVPGDVVLRLDDFTEDLWGAFSQAIAAVGLDL